MTHHAYELARYHLTLSTWEGIAPGASHWYCTVVRYDQRHEADLREIRVERGRGDARTLRFDTRAQAVAAGLRKVRQIAEGYYLVIDGRSSCLDPQRCLRAPGNLRGRLNRLWRRFEALDGWEAPKERWPEVDKIARSWAYMTGQPIPDPIRSDA